jgi:chromosome partitioning protein
MTTEAAFALSQHGTVAPTIIHHRTDFAASMIDGRTVMEIPKAGRSAEEIKKLWEYLDARTSAGQRKTIMPSSSAAEGQKQAFNVGV